MSNLRTLGFCFAGLLSLSTAWGQSPEWTQLTPANSPPRTYSHAMAYDAARGVTVMFGGQLSMGYSRDTWEWSGATWSRVTNVGPSARTNPAMAFDSQRRVVVLFGGGTDSGKSSETWEWDGLRWDLRSSNGPTARSTHAMAYDASRGRTVLFGGLVNCCDQQSDTWEWDGNSWTLASTQGPPRTEYPEMVFDSVRQRIVLFGGYSSWGPTSSTWTWDGTTWEEHAVPGPTPRFGHSLVFDSDRGVAVAFGGKWSLLPNAADFGDTWEWSGSSWTHVSDAGPGALRHHAATYDEMHHEMVLFGGDPPAGEVLSQTWAYRVPCVNSLIVAEPTDTTVTANGSTNFFVQVATVSGCTSPATFQWQRRNPAVQDSDAPNAWLDLSEGGTYLNTRGSGLVITQATPAIATGFRCKITGGCPCESPPDGFVYSRVVNLSVECPADFNADGGVDFQDVEAFFLRWENGC